VIPRRPTAFSWTIRSRTVLDEVARLGMFVFVHPRLKLNYSRVDGFDTARSVGAIFTDHGNHPPDQFRRVRPPPNLTVHMAHLSGGIASVLAAFAATRTRTLGTRAMRAMARADKDFDHYLRNNMVFDTAGFAGASAR